jgi:hypothetical protein
LRTDDSRMASAVLTAEFDQVQWEKVSSSNLDYVAYVPGIGRLWVWFRRKPGTNPKYSVYAYDHVPQSAYDGLMNAASHGAYFSANIKNRYAVTAVA